MARVCISVDEETKKRLKAMGSKGDTYDEVINGLVEIVHLLSDPEKAFALAKYCGLDDKSSKEIKKFSEALVDRGKRFRKTDYEAQKIMVRLDLLS